MVLERLQYLHTGEGEYPDKGIHSNLEGKSKHGLYVGRVVEDLLTALIDPGYGVNIQGGGHFFNGSGTLMRHSGSKCPHHGHLHAIMGTLVGLGLPHADMVQ